MATRTRYLDEAAGDDFVQTLYNLQHQCKNEHKRLQEAIQKREMLESESGFSDDRADDITDEQLANARTAASNYEHVRNRAAPELKRLIQDLETRTEAELKHLENRAGNVQRHEDRYAVQKGRRAAWQFLESTHSERTAEETDGISVAQKRVASMLRPNDKVSLQDLQTLMADKQKSSWSLQEVVNQLQRARITYERHKGELAEKTAKIESLDGQIRARDSQSAETDREISDLSAEVSGLRRERNDAQARLKTADAEILRRIATVEHEKRIGELDQEHRRAMDRQSFENSMASDQKLESQRHEYEKLLGEQEKEHQAAATKASEALLKAQGEISKLKADLSHAKTRETNLEGKIASASSQAQHGDNAKNSKIDELTEQLQDQRSRVAEQSELLESVRSERDRLKTEIASKLAEVDGRDKSAQALTTLHNEAKARLESARDSLQSQLDEANDVKARNEATILEIQERNNDLAQSLSGLQLEKDDGLLGVRKLQEKLDKRDEELSMSSKDLSAAQRLSEQYKSNEQKLEEDLQNAEGGSKSLEKQVKSLQKATSKRERGVTRSLLPACTNAPQQSSTETTVERITQGICAFADTSVPFLVIQGFTNEAFDWDISTADGLALWHQHCADPNGAPRKLWLHACCGPRYLTTAIGLIERTRETLCNQANATEARENDLAFVLVATRLYAKYWDEDPEHPLLLAFVLLRCIELVIRLGCRVTLEDLKAIVNRITEPLDETVFHQPLLYSLLVWTRLVLWEPENCDSVLGFLMGMQGLQIAATVTERQHDPPAHVKLVGTGTSLLVVDELLQSIFEYRQEDFQQTHEHMFLSTVRARPMRRASGDFRYIPEPFHFQRNVATLQWTSQHLLDAEVSDQPV